VIRRFAVLYVVVVVFGIVVSVVAMRASG